MTQDYLSHHGIDGMKWGIRRYQNEDGTRTPLGQRHRREIEGIKNTVKNTASKVKEHAKNAATKIKSFAEDNSDTLIKAAIATAAVASTAVLISRNKSAISSFVKSISSTTLKTVQSAKSTVNVGKTFVNKTMQNTANKVKKVGTTAKNIYNSSEVQSFNKQMKRTGQKVGKLVTDPRGREAVKKAATTYGKAGVEVGTRVGKTTLKAASLVGRGVEKIVDDLYAGKKPIFLKTKIALGALATHKIISSSKKKKEEREYKNFQKEQYKEWKKNRK